MIAARIESEVPQGVEDHDPRLAETGRLRVLEQVPNRGQIVREGLPDPPADRSCTSPGDGRFPRGAFFRRPRGQLLIQEGVPQIEGERHRPRRILGEGPAQDAEVRGLAAEEADVRRAQIVRVRPELPRVRPSAGSPAAALSFSDSRDALSASPSDPMSSSLTRHARPNSDCVTAR